MALDKLAVKALIDSNVYTNTSSDCEGDDIAEAIQAVADNYTHNDDVRPDSLLVNDIQQDLSIVSGVVDWDVNDGAVGVLALDENITFNFPSNTVRGKTVKLIIDHVTAGNTITWNAGFKVPGTFAISTGIGDLDLLEFTVYYDGTDTSLLLPGTNLGAVPV